MDRRPRNSDSQFCVLQRRTGKMGHTDCWNFYRRLSMGDWFLGHPNCYCCSRHNRTSHYHNSRREVLVTGCGLNRRQSGFRRAADFGRTNRGLRSLLMGVHSGAVFHHAKNAGLRQFGIHLGNFGSSIKIQAIACVWVGIARPSWECQLRILEYMPVACWTTQTSERRCV